MTPTPSTFEITGVILEDQTGLTLDQLCQACATRAEQVIELVDEGILAPAGASSVHSPEVWRFTGVHLHRARVALRLQGDLGVNLAGAALALELMDEMDNLRAQLRKLTSM